MKETVCVCGTRNVLRFLDTGHSRATVQCTCGVIRTAVRPDDYETLYTEGQKYHNDEMDKIGREHYEDRFDHDVKLGNVRIQKLANQMRLLDVGCANGGFLQAAKQAGFSAEGIELNPWMAGVAASKSGCRVHTSWAGVDGQFDVVVYNDVFEHVIDPHEELVKINEHIKSQGRLIIDCPDAAECFGSAARAPHHVKPDQHLWYWTELTLTTLLTDNRFTIDYVERPIVGKLVVYARKYW